MVCRSLTSHGQLSRLQPDKSKCTIILWLYHDEWEDGRAQLVSEVPPQTYDVFRTSRSVPELDPSEQICSSCRQSYRDDGPEKQYIIDRVLE